MAIVLSIQNHLYLAEVSLSILRIRFSHLKIRSLDSAFFFFIFIKNWTMSLINNLVILFGRLTHTTQHLSGLFLFIIWYMFKQCKSMLTLTHEKQLQNKPCGSVSPDNEQFAISPLYDLLSLSCLSVDNRALPLSSLSLPD